MAWNRPLRLIHNSGFTLVEILIGSGIALLVLLLFFALFLGGRKLLSFGTEGLQFHQAAFALQAMANDLETNGEKLYFPDNEDLFQDYGVSSVVFGNSKGEIVGYVYDANQERLLRILYDSHFNPADSSTLQLSSAPGNIRVLTTNLSYVEFQADPDLLLDLLVLPSGAAKPLETKVAVPWFQVSGP